MKVRGVNKPKRGGRVLGFIGDQISDDDKHSGDGRLDYLSLDQIQLTDQVRTLGISVDEIISHAEELQDLTKTFQGVKQEQLLNIIGLAKSIKSQGLIQPISVYEVSGGYEIIAGERRFLAHHLLKEKIIRALIKPKPSQANLTAIQLIENIQKEDLSLKQIVNGLIKLDQELKEMERTSINAKYIMEIIGKQKTQAYNYMAILNGPTDVLEAIENEKVVSLITASKLVKITSSSDRKEALELVNDLKSDHINGIENILLKQKAKPQKKRGQGAPLKSVTLGKITKPDTVYRIIEACKGEKYIEDKFGNTNWKDLKSVKKAWDIFLKEFDVKVSK
jgi:ParB/RepB/Spo0J family partition protein